MKICVITVYDSLNSGSYWQAFCLKMILEKMGNEVFFLERNKMDKINLLALHLKKIIGSFFVKGLKSGINKIKINNSFWKLQKVFNVIDYKKVNEMDLIIIGSDTLWNIEDKYFKKNYKLFFGGQFPNKRQIAYAVSASNTNKNDIEKLENFDNYLNNFESIGVRDRRTYDLIENYYRGHIFNVCDPTFLLKKEDYEKFIIKPKICYNYIFLYLFEKLSNVQECEIKKFAKNNNLKIVDGIGNKGTYDIVSPNTPLNFLSNINHAEYVITDTFHGTIFSINFNKRFVTIDRKKQKVNDFIDKCNLRDRLIDTQELSFVLNNQINYEKTNMILDEFRNESISFLQNALR